MHKTIYCISGLGADEKVFRNLHFRGYKMKYIPWLVPEKREKINAYASRMAAHITEESPVLLGVSFGGMMGIEIAKQLPMKKLFIISSIKNTVELPGWMKVVGKMQLNKFLPTRSYKFTEKLDNDRLGVSNEEEKMMVRDYRRNADPVYVNWAIDQVLNWKNGWHPDYLVHIHGDRDKMFPIKRINATHVISGGTHMMIYNRAAEISHCIEKELSG